MFPLENEFHATITASFEGATTAYPVPLSIAFTQSVQQIAQSQLIVCILVWLQAQVTNAVVSSFTQVSLTELTLAVTPQEPGEITLTLDERPGESEIDATEQQAQAELEGQTAPDTDIPDFGGFEGYGCDYDME